MSVKNWNIYLSGEIHSDWRKQIIDAVDKEQLPVTIFSPVTDHASSDECGVKILGEEDKKFWKDHKGAKLNAIRNKKLINDSDIVIVRFGDKYKQWNAAFDAGYASALGKSVIVQHPEEYIHALKEVDAAAMATAETVEQVIELLKYITK